MKKWIVLFILLVIPLAASAEVSTNLKIQTINVQNSKRLVESITYVDDEGNAVIPTDKGYATVKYTYGVGKKVAQESYLDENGNPVNCIDGYAFIKYKYSASKLIETAYYDIDNNLTTGPDGYARQVVTYQGYYRQSVWEYDPEGNPVGIHNITEYEKISGRTLVVSDSWYDAEDKLASGPNGYARVEYEYDGKNRSKTTYISSDGSLYFYKKAGFAIKETKYERSNIIAEYYYGADHELTAGPDGYAYIIYTYNR